MFKVDLIYPAEVVFTLKTKYGQNYRYISAITQKKINSRTNGFPDYINFSLYLANGFPSKWNLRILFYV